MSAEATADIGVTGLSVMGRDLARNLAHHGYTVAVHNRSVERTRSLIDEHDKEGEFVASESMADFVAQAARPRTPGAPTPAALDRCLAPKALCEAPTRRLTRSGHPTRPNTST
jgi:6-phosphogluconate dehydrogenase